MVNIMYVEDVSGQTQYFDCPYCEEELKKMIYEIKEKNESEIRWKIEPQILFLAYCQKCFKSSFCVQNSISCLILFCKLQSFSL